MPARIPTIAIVGRPNVGKSTLFNRLVGGRRSIVKDEPGITRDRIDADGEIDGHAVRWVDTGGFIPENTVADADAMLALMRDQAKVAIDAADAVVWLTSVRDDVTPADEAIAGVLRFAKQPVFLAVNKCDTDRLETAALSFYELGFETLVPIAAEHGRGIGDLLDGVVEALQQADAFREVAEPEDAIDPETLEALRARRGGYVDRIRMCIVGRPNVGKSTLLNAMIGHERVLASDVPGTTRDAVDVPFETEEGRFVLIDTAGMRRPARVQVDVEQWSVSQAVRAIERSHVVLLVLDATQTLAEQDARIASLIARRRRACVVVVNKWDAVEKDTDTMRAYGKDLDDQMPMLAHAPRVFVSALTKSRLHKLLPVVQEAFTAFDKQVGTGALNRWLQDIQRMRQPPVYRNKRLKMYYMVQTAVRPPTFVVQVNMADAAPPNYHRFLIKNLRETFDLHGAPIILQLKKKQSRRARKPTTVEGEAPELPRVIDLDGDESAEDAAFDLDAAEDYDHGPLQLAEPASWPDDFSDDGDDGDDDDAVRPLEGDGDG
jgi:GTP-binding protein